MLMLLLLSLLLLLLLLLRYGCARVLHINAPTVPVAQREAEQFLHVREKKTGVRHHTKSMNWCAATPALPLCYPSLPLSLPLSLSSSPLSLAASTVSLDTIIQ